MDSATITASGSNNYTFLECGFTPPPDAKVFSGWKYRTDTDASTNTFDIFDGGHRFSYNLCKEWILSQYNPPLLRKLQDNKTPERLLLIRKFNFSL